MPECRFHGLVMLRSGRTRVALRRSAAAMLRYPGFDRTPKASGCFPTARPHRWQARPWLAWPARLHHRPAASPVAVEFATHGRKQRLQGHAVRLDQQPDRVRAAHGQAQVGVLTPLIGIQVGAGRVAGVAQQPQQQVLGAELLAARVGRRRRGCRRSSCRAGPGCGRIPSRRCPPDLIGDTAALAGVILPGQRAVLSIGTSSIR